MLRLINIIFSLLPDKSYKKIIFFIFVSFFFNLINIFSLSLLIPFFSAIMDSNILLNSKIFSIIVSYFPQKFREFNQFMIIYSFFLIFLLFLSSSFLLINENIKLNLIKEIGTHISKTYIDMLVNANYFFFLNYQKGKAISNILLEIEYIVNNVFNTFFELITRTFIVFVIILGLLTFKPDIVFIAIFILVSLIFLIYKFIKNKLKDYGQKIAFANIKRSEKTTEILNNFINLKIYNLKKNYIDKFVYFTKLYFIYFSKTEVTKKLPKIFLEFIFFTIVILIIIYMIFSNSLDNKTGILMVSTFGIAAYRLMPSVQQIFFSLSTIKNSYPKLLNLYNDINDFKKNKLNSSINENILNDNNSNIIIEAKNISFKYDKKFLFKNLNFKITLNSKTCIVGESGAGKTTLLLIILGIIKPSSGSLKINNRDVYKLSDQIRSNLFSYSPQLSSLFLGNLKSNITLGRFKEKKFFNYTIKLAILNKLKNLRNNLKLKNKVSGGEAKKILLARAFFHNSPILVLDEPTSYLDASNAKKLIFNLDKINKKIIIFTSHDHNLEKIAKNKIIL